MADLQALMAAAQRAGVDPQQVMGAMGGGGGGMPPGGGGAPPAPGGGMPPGGGGGDPSGGLMGLVSGVMSSPQGMQMVQALSQALMSQPDVGPGSTVPGGPPAASMPGQQRMGAYINRGPNAPMVEYDDGMQGETPDPRDRMIVNSRPTDTNVENFDAKYGGRDNQIVEYDNDMQGDDPDPRDIEIVSKRPTDTNVENFDAKYGDGASARYVNGGGGKGGKMSTEQELDLARKMMGADKDEENHKKGIYGRRGRGEPLRGDELDDDD